MAMKINDANFPIVWMYWTEASEHDPFKQLEELLRRETPFVLMTADSSDQEPHEHSPGERKKITLWMKANKARLRLYIKAMIVIEPNAAKRFAAKTFAIAFEKFWGYPLLTGENREVALLTAQALLAPSKRRKQGGQ
jgi:hypothetical protein